MIKTHLTSLGPTLRTAALLGVAGIILAACGPGSASTPNSPSSRPAAAAPGAAADTGGAPAAAGP
ncbi:MAG: hypothetical protein ACYDGR_13440, partial [Candidatus Dormibacteria bacterium]